MNQVFDSNRRHVTMFAKAPVAGKVKTRLAASIGYEHAANLHGAFLSDLGQTLEQLTREDSSTTVSLSLSGDAEHPTFVSLREARGLAFRDQGEGDLGARLSLTVKEALEDGVEQLLIIGSDSPTLATRHFHRAFEALEQGADIVLGPSFDGGYYLIGMSGFYPRVFEEIDWSTPRVLHQTLERAREVELNVELLEFWYDVDELEDLLLLRTHLLQHLACAHGEQYSDTRTMIEKLESILD
jgi:hypothetical protein